MRTYRLAVLVLLLTSTCGAPEATDEPIAMHRSALDKSGTRIQIRRTVTTYATADGSSYDVDLGVTSYDSKLGVWCTPQKTTDGVLRCVPAERATLGEAFYSDTTCTTQLAYSVGCGGQKYAVESRTSATLCNTDTQVTFYPIIIELKGGHWFSKSGTSCLDLGPIPSAYRVFKIGPAMLPSEFVAATVTTTSTALP